MSLPASKVTRGGLNRLEVMGAPWKMNGVEGARKGWWVPLWSGGRHSEVVGAAREVAGATRCSRLSILRLLLAPRGSSPSRWSSFTCWKYFFTCWKDHNPCDTLMQPLDETDIKTTHQMVPQGSHTDRWCVLTRWRWRAPPRSGGRQGGCGGHHITLAISLLLSSTLQVYKVLCGSDVVSFSCKLVFGWWSLLPDFHIIQCHEPSLPWVLHWVERPWSKFDGHWTHVHGGRYIFLAPAMPNDKF